MSLRIFLLTRNEELMLEDWLLYHGHLFGFENIFVIDGSTSQGVFDIYEKYSEQGLNVFHDTSSLNDLGEVLTEQMNRNKGNDNFLIKVDTDEFIALAGYPRYLLSARVCRRTPFYDYTGGFVSLGNHRMRQFFAGLPLTGQVYKAAFTTWSIPLRRTPGAPCRELTAFTPIQSTVFKSFFHSASFKSVDLGGHTGTTLENRGLLMTPLCIIHYHSVSVEDSLRRARQVLESHGYISPTDDDSTCIDKLQNTLDSCDERFLLSYHKVRLYLEYLVNSSGGGGVDSLDMNGYHPYYKPSRYSRSITLVKDTLKEADCANYGSSATVGRVS